MSDEEMVGWPIASSTPTIYQVLILNVTICVLFLLQCSASFKMTEDDILFDEAYELQEVIWRYIHCDWMKNKLKINFLFLLQGIM